MTSVQYDDDNLIDPLNLFVNYLPPSYSETQLHNLFKPFGDIVSAKVQVDPNTGLSLCYGFIRFSSPEQASLAVAKMNGLEVDGTNIAVRFSHSSKHKEEYSPKKTIFVRNIDEKTSFDDIVAIFSPFGTVECLKLDKDMYSLNHSHQIAYIRMSSVEEAQNSIDGLNGKKMGECLIPMCIAFAKKELKTTMSGWERRGRRGADDDHLSDSTDSIVFTSNAPSPVSLSVLIDENSTNHRKSHVSAKRGRSSRKVRKIIDFVPKSTSTGHTSSRDSLEVPSSPAAKSYRTARIVRLTPDPVKLTPLSAPPGLILSPIVRSEPTPKREPLSTPLRMAYPYPPGLGLSFSSLKTSPGASKAVLKTPGPAATKKAQAQSTTAKKPQTLSYLFPAHPPISTLSNKPLSNSMIRLHPTSNTHSTQISEDPVFSSHSPLSTLSTKSFSDSVLPAHHTISSLSGKPLTDGISFHSPISTVSSTPLLDSVFPSPLGHFNTLDSYRKPSTAHAPCMPTIPSFNSSPFTSSASDLAPLQSKRTTTPSSLHWDDSFLENDGLALPRQLWMVEESQGVSASLTGILSNDHSDGWMDRVNEDLAESQTNLIDSFKSYLTPTHAPDNGQEQAPAKDVPTANLSHHTSLSSPSQLQFNSSRQTMMVADEQATDRARIESDTSQKETGGVQKRPDMKQQLISDPADVATVSRFTDSPSMPPHLPSGRMSPISEQFDKQSNKRPALFASPSSSLNTDASYPVSDSSTKKEVEDGTNTGGSTSPSFFHSSFSSHLSSSPMTSNSASSQHDRPNTPLSTASLPQPAFLYSPFTMVDMGGTVMWQSGRDEGNITQQKLISSYPFNRTAVPSHSFTPSPHSKGSSATVPPLYLLSPSSATTTSSSPNDFHLIGDVRQINTPSAAQLALPNTHRSSHPSLHAGSLPSQHFHRSSLPGGHSLNDFPTPRSRGGSWHAENTPGRRRSDHQTSYLNQDDTREPITISAQFGETQGTSDLHLSSSHQHNTPSSTPVPTDVTSHSKTHSASFASPIQPSFQKLRHTSTHPQVKPNAHILDDHIPKLANAQTARTSAQLTSPVESTQLSSVRASPGTPQPTSSTVTPPASASLSHRSSPLVPRPSHSEKLHVSASSQDPSTHTTFTMPLFPNSSAFPPFESQSQLSSTSPPLDASAISVGYEQTEHVESSSSRQQTESSEGHEQAKPGC